jgi:hypothetical protein
MVSKRSAPTVDHGYSMYRAVLVDNAKALSTGAVTQSDLLAALEEHSRVWMIESMPQGSKFIVTFKDPEAVTQLVKHATLPVGSAKLTVEGYKIQTKPALEDEVCCCLRRSPRTHSLGTPTEKPMCRTHWRECGLF